MFSVGHGSRTKWYNFGGDPDHASDLGVQSPKSGSSGSAEVCSLGVHSCLTVILLWFIVRMKSLLFSLISMLQLNITILFVHAFTFQMPSVWQRMTWSLVCNTILICEKKLHSMLTWQVISANTDGTHDAALCPSNHIARHTMPELGINCIHQATASVDIDNTLLHWPTAVSF